MELNENTFDGEVTGSEVPAFVFFWASWCTACKRTQEMIKKLAVEFNGRVKVCSLNVDRNFSLSEKYQIQGVPTFIIFIDGIEIKREIGAKSRKQLEEMVREVI